MKSSKNADEWNKNCDAVKAANHGEYPDFWYREIVVKKVMQKTVDSWNSGR